MPVKGEQISEYLGYSQTLCKVKKQKVAVMK